MRFLVWALLVAASAPAAVPVRCPASCTTGAALAAAAGKAQLEVRCDGQRAHVKLDFGAGHVVTREVPQTVDGCRSLPEVVTLLAAPFAVQRTPAPLPVAPAAPAAPGVARPEPPPATPPREVVPPPTAPAPAPTSAPPLVETLAETAPPPVAVAPAPPPAPPPHVFFGVDVGGALQASPLAGLFRARVTAAPFAQVGFFAEGGFSSRASTPLGALTAQSVMQQGALGALVTWRAAHLGGPQLAVDVGLEHVRATQARSDEGVGVVLGVRAEWVQHLPLGFFGRASVGVDLRPAPWSVQAGGVTAVAVGNVSVIAGLALGWSPSNVWGW